MRFEKVKKECFLVDAIKNGFNIEAEVDRIFDDIIMPERKTQKSAGYDFATPLSFGLAPNQKKVIPTGIKAKMDKGEVLLFTVRSSVGINMGVVFSNAVAVIDADYYGNGNNDGDIMFSLWNTSNEDVYFDRGDRIAQGVFLKFGITEDDNATGERKGGIGSTGVNS